MLKPDEDQTEKMNVKGTPNGNAHVMQDQKVQCARCNWTGMLSDMCRGNKGEGGCPQCGSLVFPVEAPKFIDGLTVETGPVYVPAYLFTMTSEDWEKMDSEARAVYFADLVKKHLTAKEQIGVALEIGFNGFAVVAKEILNHE